MGLVQSSSRTQSLHLSLQMTQRVRELINQQFFKILNNEMYNNTI